MTQDKTVRSSDPTDSDRKIIEATTRDGDQASDVIQRVLRLLERVLWQSQARDDAERLADEDLSDERDAW